ncbi:MAG TPA: sulfotransferase [Tahibacter sp.]|uniref:tetratricopeptide repeat-containing sulfotransferase family protein n=1 Tax=Tahibacter sp. TaxID=2056211 RepID=UPI002B7B8C01|nr:sulfotransferase [Tahibacter sp.]HSX58770.1 sulfotransferase [Tahibacter sp.]
MLRDAFAHIENGRYREAEEACLQALAADADDTAASTLLALSWQAQQRLAEAIALFERLAALPGAGFEAFNNLGNALREAGRSEAADGALRAALARSGEHAGVLLNLGLNALDLGDAAVAQRWLERALLQAPHDAEIRTYAAAAAFEQGDLAKARALLARDLRWQDVDTGVIAEAAWLLFRLDATDAADALLRFALARDPRHPRALLRLAAIHERCNRLDDANAVAAALAAHDGADAAFAEDLSLLRAALASRGRDARTARALHEALLADGRASLHNANVYFSLARACDRDGDPAGAMQALERAHAARCTLLRRRAPKLFDAPPLAGARQRLDAQRAAWTPDPAAPDAAASPIFVVGFPRSGTTLLETMLDAHPALACMDERAYLQDLVEYLQAGGLDHPGDLGRLTPGQCAAMRAIYRERVARHVDWNASTRLVDKNPLNLLKLPLIRRIYPHARIVLALRHPADVVLSNYMQNFRSPVFVALCETLRTTAEGYAAAMDFWIDQHALLGGDVFVSRYEDLVADLPARARALTEFLGVPWDDALLRPDAHARERGYISTPSYAQVAEPVNTRAIGRWQAYAEWIAPLRPLLDPYARRWGYAW